MAKALVRNRSWDQNLDGIEDSGADFWTAYTFHTRDVVRQTAVDYMQLIRVMRSWDGKQLWKADINGNGLADDIAGDLDGDGTVDVGGPDANYNMTGASLGGIMSAVVGGLEPHLNATVPIAGGGGLTDVGVRSIQGGVKEAVTLRVMGPIYVAKPSGKAGEAVRIDTIVPNLNKTAEVHVTSVPADVAAQLKVGDTVRVDNLDNDEYDCARLIKDASAGACGGDADVKRCWTFRVRRVSGEPLRRRLRRRPEAQRHVLRFFKGDAFVSGEQDEVASLRLKAASKPCTPSTPSIAT